MHSAAVDNNFIPFFMLCNYRTGCGKRNILFRARANLELHYIVKNEIARSDFIYTGELINYAAARSIAD